MLSALSTCYSCAAVVPSARLSFQTFRYLLRVLAVDYPTRAGSVHPRHTRNRHPCKGGKSLVAERIHLGTPASRARVKPNRKKRQKKKIHHCVFDPTAAIAWIAMVAVLLLIEGEMTEKTTITVTEEQRQGLLKALGHLAVESPGWHKPFLQPIAALLEGPDTRLYDMYRRTWDRERREAALYTSHALLRHYSELLNQHDGGSRKIPEALEDWIDRCERVAESELPE